MTSYQKELQALRDGSKRPENYGKPWTDKEISELRALFLQCYDISYLGCPVWQDRGGGVPAAPKGAHVFQPMSQQRYGRREANPDA